MDSRRWSYLRNGNNETSQLATENQKTADAGI